MQSEILYRTDAIKEGKTRFFTGLPCIRGHRALRQTSNGNCVECIKKRKQKNKKVDLYKKQREAWLRENKKRLAELARAERK